MKSRAKKRVVVGCNIYDERRLSYLGNVAVTIAGVVTTQAIALFLLALGSRQKLGSLKRRLILLMALVFMTDAPAQVFQGLHANIEAQQRLTRVDFADTLYLIMQRTLLPSTTVKVMLACCLALYALLVAWVYVRGKRRAKTEAQSGVA